MIDKNTPMCSFWNEHTLLCHLLARDIKASGLFPKPTKHWDEYSNLLPPAVGLKHPRSRAARKLSFDFGIVFRVT